MMNHAEVYRRIMYNSYKNQEKNKALTVKIYKECTLIMIDSKGALGYNRFNLDGLM